MKSKTLLLIALCVLCFTEINAAGHRPPKKQWLAHWVFRGAGLYRYDSTLVKVEKLNRKKCIIKVAIAGSTKEQSDLSVEVAIWATKWLINRGYNIRKMSFRCYITTLGKMKESEKPNFYGLASFESTITDENKELGW